MQQLLQFQFQPLPPFHHFEQIFQLLLSSILADNNIQNVLFTASHHFQPLHQHMLGDVQPFHHWITQQPPFHQDVQFHQIYQFHQCHQKLYAHCEQRSHQFQPVHQYHAFHQFHHLQPLYQ